MAMMQSIKAPRQAAPMQRRLDVPLTKETVEDRPWTSVVVESRTKKAVAGIFGIGMKVAVEKNFDVLAVTGLKDHDDRSINSKVTVGDILCFVNDRSVVKEGAKIIQTTIWGEEGSMLKLTLKSSKTGSLYDVMAKRHVFIEGTDYNQQWYCVKEEYSGGELLTDSRIVSCLDAIRHCAIDEQGREVDFLAGIKKRGSSTGLFLSPEKVAGGRKVDTVVEGSPASMINIKPGDIINSVDGESSHESIGAFLGSEQRIGSVCKVNITRQGGRKEQVELVRTQVASMHRAEEMMNAIDELSDTSPEAKTALKKKVVELEKERQYEERVMAGRLNASNTVLLEEVWKAAETLVPPRPIQPDYSEALENLKRTNAELTRALQLANSRSDDLAAEVKRLTEMNEGMVPVVELEHIREELANMKKLLADMVSKDQYNKMEASLQGIIQKLRDEKKELEDKLKASEQNCTSLQVENDDLKRRLKLMEEENLALKNDAAAMKNAQLDMVSKDQYAQMEQSLQDIIAKLRAEKKDLEDKLKDSEKKNAALQAENDELKRRIASLEDENAALTKERAELKSQLREMQGGRDGAASEVESLKRQLKAAQDDIEELKKKLQAADSAGGAMQAENDALKRKIKTLEDENADLRAQLEAMRKDLTAARAELDRLSVENDALKRKVEGLESANAELNKQVKALQDKVKAAEAEADKWRKIAEPLQAKDKATGAELEAANAKIKALTEENNKAETEIASLKGDVAALKEELKRAKEENAEVWKQLEAAKKQIRDLTDQVAKLEQEKQTLQKELAAANDQVAKLKSDIEANNKKMRSTEDAGIKAKAEIEGLKSELQAANSKIASLESQLKGEKEANAKLQEELKKAHERAAKLQTELDKANSEIANQKEEIRKLKLQVGELDSKLKATEADVARLQGLVDGLTKDLAEANKTIANQKEEIRKLKLQVGELDSKLKATEADVARLQGLVDGLTKDLAEANKTIANQKEEIRKLKLQVEELNRKLKATEADVARLQGLVDGLTKDLAEANKKIASLEDALDAEKKAMADLKKKMEAAIAELEKKLKKAEAEAADFKKRMEELTKDLAAANKKIAGLEDALDAEKKAHAALKKKFEDATSELAKLKSELETTKKLLADRSASADTLDTLLRELKPAKLDEPKFRAEFLSSIIDEPILQPAGVLRLIKAAKALQPTKLETVCEVLETMTDPCVVPGDVLELLKNLRDGKPKRTAIEAQLIVKVLNQEEAWSGELLLQMREALRKENVTRPEQIIICPDRHAHGQVEFLKQRIRELLAPDFDQKGCTFMHRTPLTIRGRPGSTIYACIQDESVRPTKQHFDKCCPSPMELVIDDSVSPPHALRRAWDRHWAVSGTDVAAWWCVVTAIATMQGALEGGDDLSASKVEAFHRKRMVTREAVEGLARAVPILPEERVGVGMLIEKSDGNSDIVVKEITRGGEVEKDGRVSVGDVLLEVDGKDLDGVDLHNVWELIMGPPATEVVMVLERKGAQRGGEGVVADNLYSVRLFRTRNEAVPSTFSPQSFVDSGRKLLVGTLDSGKSLLDGITHTASAAGGPRAPMNTQSPLSSGRFSTINPNASLASTSMTGAQSPIMISNSPGSSFNKGPGVDSPGIYNMPSSQPGGKGDVLIAM